MIENLKIVLTSFLITLLTFVVLMMISSKVPLMGIRSFVVQTGSMGKALPVGSVVFVRPSASYEVGDVVTFKNKADLLVTHRIIQKIDGQFRVKGDANKDADSDLVSQSNIVGKEIYFLPFLGKIAGILKTLPGFVTLIILPSLLFIGSEILSIKRELEKEIEKKVRMSLRGTQ